MLTCREFADFLMAYLDGEVPEAQRTEFEEHVQMCPPCVHYLETYRQAVAMGRELCRDDDEPVPADVPENLVQAILAARRKA